MTDVRTRLSEALDEAERLAKAATAGPWRYNPNKQWLTHDDPATRKLLTWMGARGEEFVGAGPLDAAVCVAGTGPADDPQSQADAAFIARWDPSTALRLVEYFRQELAEIDSALADDADDETTQGRLERAAAFWLGTQEADRPRMPQHCTTSGCRNAPTQLLNGEPRCDFCVSVITGSSEVSER